MSDENPIQQRLAAISGLQTGKRVISSGVRLAPSLALPEALSAPHPAPKKVRPPQVWSPERRAAHAKKMVKMWADPKFRKKQAKIAQASMKRVRSNPEAEARRLANLKTSFAMKKAGR